MDLGAKQVVLWRICSQLQYQSKMTEIPEEAFVMDCIEYDAVAKKVNKAKLFYEAMFFVIIFSYLK